MYRQWCAATNDAHRRRSAQSRWVEVPVASARQAKLQLARAQMAPRLPTLAQLAPACRRPSGRWPRGAASPARGSPTRAAPGCGVPRVRQPPRRCRPPAPASAPHSNAAERGITSVLSPQYWAATWRAPEPASAPSSWEQSPAHTAVLLAGEDPTHLCGLWLRIRLLSRGHCKTTLVAKQRRRRSILQSVRLCDSISCRQAILNRPLCL